MDDINDITIVGGGLAGLTLAVLLRKAGFEVRIIEKKKYPFHRVCGEYISNEVKDFLKSQNLFPAEHRPTEISKLKLTATDGRSVSRLLPLGGFGISRYHFDHYLAKEAVKAGANLLEETTVTDVFQVDNHYNLVTSKGNFLTKLVIGCYGKRSNLDNKFSRSFFSKPSPYLGVKYHIKTDFPSDTIALHNFKDGYCGISMVEDNTFNLCYLSHQKNLKAFGSIENMEENVLFRNPEIKAIFENSEFLFKKPLTINEISFASKPLIENGIIMCGDAAGMITPLCGNGMAMAIHGAKILSESISQSYCDGGFNQAQLERSYTGKWTKAFSLRLNAGRAVQKLFGGHFTSQIALNLLRSPLWETIVSLTHGKPLKE